MSCAGVPEIDSGVPDEWWQVPDHCLSVMHGHRASRIGLVLLTCFPLGVRAPCFVQGSLR